MLILINKKESDGRIQNSRLFNVVAWSTTVIVVCAIAGADGGVDDGQGGKLIDQRMLRAICQPQGR